MPGRSFKVRALLLRILMFSAALFLVYFFVITLLVIWNFRVNLTKWPTYLYCSHFKAQTGQSIDEIDLIQRIERLGYEKSNALEPLSGQYTFNGKELMVNLRPSVIRGVGLASGPVGIDIENGIIKSIRMLRSNQKVNWFHLQPELISIVDKENKYPSLMRRLELSDINPTLIWAVVLTEDMRFYEHKGIDPTSIMRAIKANWRAGEYVQGASTIPQQLIKMTMLSPEKKMRRKIIEASMAIVADLIYSKDEILQSYLNRVYFGHIGKYPVRGVGEACRLYFAKECSDLDAEECATLAAMIKAPNVISPFKRPARVLRRRNMILGLLKDAGKITEQEYIRASNAAISMRKPNFSQVSAKAFLNNVIINNDINWLDKIETSRLGYVLTTLDPIEQKKASELLNSIKADGTKGRLILADSHSGAIKAYAGSADWIGSGGDPGVYSPFIIFSGLTKDNGAPPRFSLASPFFINGKSEKAQTFRQAFYNNRKLFLNKLTLELGRSNIAKSLNLFEIPFERSDQGGFEIISQRPLFILERYAFLSGLGSSAELSGLKDIKDGISGRDKEKRLLVNADPAAIYLVNRLLKPYPMKTKGPRSPAALWKIPSINVSSDQTGAWGVAYWCNNMALIRLSVPNVEYSAMEKVLKAALPKPKYSIHKSYPTPEDLLFRNVCLESGLRATSLCVNVIKTPFIKGTQPTDWCPLKHDQEARSQDIN